MNKFLLLLPAGVVSSVGVGLGLWFSLGREEFGETLSSLPKNKDGCYLIRVDINGIKKQEPFCLKPEQKQALTRE